MIKFNLPGFYHLFNLNKNLLILKRDFPEYFYDDIKIECFYDLPYFCIFDGGRMFNSDTLQCTKEKLENILCFFNYEFNTPIRLICTNTELKPEDYYDRFGNFILASCQNGLNQITVSDDKFQEYILNTYPNYKLVSSTTKCIISPNELKQELQKDNYYLVCLDYNLNKNFSLLESLSENEKKKCEFLCNAICPPGCQERKKHYKINSLYSLNYGKNTTLENCGINGTTCASARNYKNNITPNEIYTKYAPMGFEQFKLEGRTLKPIEVALNYTYYLIKPEYKDTALIALLWNDKNGI